MKARKTTVVGALLSVFVAGANAHALECGAPPAPTNPVEESYMEIWKDCETGFFIFHGNKGGLFKGKVSSGEPLIAIPENAGVAIQSGDKTSVATFRWHNRYRNSSGVVTIGTLSPSAVVIVEDLHSPDGMVRLGPTGQIVDVQEATSGEGLMLQDGTLPPAEFMEFTFPAGGEELYSGNVVEVTWVSPPGIDTVSIVLGRSAIFGPDGYALSIPNDGVFLWEVPVNTSAGCADFTLSLQWSENGTSRSLTSGPFKIVEQGATCS